ncbi:lysine-specific demethylase 2A-like, partial [Eucyclogobius newberryi]|uniref:lysine-specific demethylase 2A-like n=1 Tax=Eucyclogobius newberryi TaxID=166745 RepID=UPI003B5BCE05
PVQFQDEDSEGADLDAEDDDLDSMEEEEEEDEGQWDSDPEPPVLLMSDFSDELLSGACLSVTLQTPHRGKKQSGSIVPKLEARSSGQNPRKPPKQLKKSDTDASRGPGRPRVGAKRDTKDHYSSSDEESAAAAAAAALSMSPPSLLSLPSFKDVGNEKGGEKELWVSVFKYLSRSELLNCMLVCKAWYKWCCDKRLWTHMDISRCSPLSNQALAGIVKRQPTALDLSWTPVAKRQLNCLLTRLPGLRELSVAGLSWSCLSALVCPTLPCLRLLDLRWCDGLKDVQLKEIILPPDLESSRSRLRNTVELRVSGLEISDSTLRLIQRHMPQLQRLDLAHCKDVTDSSIAMLAASGTHTRHNLSELTLSGCDKLTDGCLLYLKRLSSLSLLDLRGCSHISRRGCDSFISDLSQTALFCMMEEKLIQRLD